MTATETFGDFLRKIGRPCLNGIDALGGTALFMLEGLAHRRDCHKTRAFRNLRGECDMLLAVGLAELLDEQQEITVPQIMRTLKWSQAYERMSILLEQVNALAETIEEAVLKNV